MTEATGGVAARDQLDIRTRDGERKKGLRTFTRHSGYIYRLLRDGHGVWLTDGRTRSREICFPAASASALHGMAAIRA